MHLGVSSSGSRAKPTCFDSLRTANRTTVLSSSVAVASPNRRLWGFWGGRGMGGRFWTPSVHTSLVCFSTCFHTKGVPHALMPVALTHVQLHQ